MAFNTLDVRQKKKGSYAERGKINAINFIIAPLYIEFYKCY